MDKDREIIILGLGNILLKDEGFGVHFVRWFDTRHTLPETVEVLDGGTLGYGLLDTVSRCRTLIVIDVIKVDDAPGSLYSFTREQIETIRPEPSSAHEVEFFHVLDLADLGGMCPEVVFLCITPEQYRDMGLDMTEAMTERFVDMERLLLGELSRLNITPESKIHA